MSKLAAVYRMTSHLFGGLWSPSAANYAIRRTSIDFTDDATVVYALQNNFYVGDVLKSCETEQEVVKLAKDLKATLAKAGFVLTKWTSNNHEVVKEVCSLDGTGVERVKSLGLSAQQFATKSLGVTWNVGEDTFGFSVSVTEKYFTRRGILSSVSSIFDPMGFASPFILLARLWFKALQKGA
jgi:hypothetical protein